MEASEVFANAYGVETVRVPSNVPSRRNDLGATVFFDRAAHLEAVSDEVSHWHRMGRPLLLTVGTVRQSAEISDELRRRGVEHRVLNAGNPTREAEIVAAAGEPGAVTVSTAMAGRGTDIIVGPEVDEQIVSACVETARRSVSRGDAVVFRCASDEEAEILAGAFEYVAEVKVRRLGSGTDIEVRGKDVSDDALTEVVQFGLGLDGGHGVDVSVSQSGAADRGAHWTAGEVWRIDDAHIPERTGPCVLQAPGWPAEHEGGWAATRGGGRGP